MQLLALLSIVILGLLMGMYKIYKSKRNTRFKVISIGILAIPFITSIHMSINVLLTIYYPFSTYTPCTYLDTSTCQQRKDCEIINIDGFDSAYEKCVNISEK